MIHSVFKKLQLPQNSIVWDLGSGDGRVVEISVAEYGCKAFGFEINDTYYQDSLRRISHIPRHLRTNAKIYKKDIFNLNLSDMKIDVLFIYATVYAYKFLQHVLKTAQAGLKIVCIRYSPTPEQIDELGLQLIDEIPEQDFVIDIDAPEILDELDSIVTKSHAYPEEKGIKKVKRKLYIPFGAKVFQRK